MRLRVLPIPVAALVAFVPLAWSSTPTPSHTGADVSRVAKRQPKVTKSPDLWATINVCDTLAHPNTIGIRGSMPGLGRPSTAWMRFKVQYLATQTDGKWHDAGPTADSGWKRIGRVRTKVIESGQNFTFESTGYRLRGVVTFKWTRHGKTVLKLSRRTEGGHRSTAGADPVGYSAQFCDIT